MFLHAGASMHGHEYSNRPSSSHSSHKLRPPLLFSALSPPKSRVTTTTTALPKKPVLRQRPASEYIPRSRTPEPLVRFLEPDVVEPQTPEMQHDDHHVFSDSEMSETAASVDGHSESGRRPRRRRTTSRKSTSTTYYLGYPTPKKLGNLKVMHTVLPRLLLQLKAVSPDGHARPMLEVFPSSRIAGLVITPRLAKRFPGIFGVKRQLGYDDLVLMKRDDDESEREGSESGDSDETFERSKLLAVYSPVKHSEETEIVLGDGSIWTAKALPNGSYDFVHVDECGHVTTARWARRSTGKTPPTTPADTPAPPPEYPRFTFSILNPLSRRHPVMATLTHCTLVVQDTYTTVSSSYGRFPPRPLGRAVSVNALSRGGSSSCPSSPQTSSPEDSEADSGIGITQPEPEPERTVRIIDEATKSLISTTALWIVLRSGWSPNYVPSTHTHSSPCSDDKSPTSPTTGNEKTRRRHTWSRPMASDSLCSSKGSTPPISRQPSDAETPRLQQPATPAQSTKPKRHSMPAQPIKKAISERGTSPAPSASNVLRPGPRRATSTGANFMRHRLLSEAQSDQELGSPISEKVRHGLQGMCPLRNRSADPLVGGGLMHSQHHYFGHQRDDSMASTYCAPIQEIRPSMDVRPTTEKVVEEEKKAREVPKLVVDTTFAVHTGVKGEKEKKPGMRMMLKRWVHKLGSR
ncbi:hypothetical protein GE21DRAFT_9388 [Neurospora crassa]|uniref:Uncharacterized protein n=1 Tax=Neurospora crassa (strain ATCC 24698 / 74-OR23-1A / CBS 708.71 / DSM 1257 / FGSC 987) TaxID=367110 RepID=Q7S1W3_NEUCR|nr:hypothetical protein NCU05958 [Neurospora crassa OR74A]EAA29336.3 hypothetical protein NCU05958 [Neurospora crassa OR74A]KHE87515.1 hypothetical protein GE21DRAFT_9388 [Neurospora crassa]|eukprot:XP_958572.3 hypothetical protein NCU05958 [Neurospora crassa OR74A]